MRFSNGILALGLVSGILVVVFGAREQALLPLYAVGVFMSFTLSQASMVVRGWRLRPPGWQRNIVISGFGSLITFVVLIVIAVTRFSEGAWAVLLLVPVMSTSASSLPLLQPRQLQTAPPWQEQQAVT